MVSLARAPIGSLRMAVRMHHARIEGERIVRFVVGIDLGKAGDRPLGVRLHKGVPNGVYFAVGKETWDDDIAVALELLLLFQRSVRDADGSA